MRTFDGRPLSAEHLKALEAHIGSQENPFGVPVVFRLLDTKEHGLSSPVILGDKELENEFRILKDGGSLVSLRGLPNGDFAKRMGMPFFKRLAFGTVGKRYDKLAAKRNQKYHFIFVHEDGEGLRKISAIFAEKQVQTSVDGVFSLDDVNKAMKKVVSGRSRGKTIIKVY